MSDFVLAPAAVSDMDEIWTYYAIDIQNADAADRIRDEIFDAFSKLANTPGLGHSRYSAAATSRKIRQTD